MGMHGQPGSVSKVLHDDGGEISLAYEHVLM